MGGCGGDTGVQSPMPHSVASRTGSHACQYLSTVSSYDSARLQWVGLNGAWVGTAFGRLATQVEGGEQEIQESSNRSVRFVNMSILQID